MKSTSRSGSGSITTSLFVFVNGYDEFQEEKRIKKLPMKAFRGLQFVPVA